MAQIAPLQGSGETVTASELVRHFGHWQRRAVQGPVYVLNHGRPQFVLASVEFMQALAAQARAPLRDDVGHILDALADPVLIVDPAGGIVAAGRATRLLFGDAARPGARADAFLPADAAALLTDMIARVAATGIRERAELPATAATARIEVTVEPHPAGALIVGRAAGIADARDAALAQARALVSAITALPQAAIATIGLRGQLIEPDDSLARLTGLTAAALAGRRAETLFSVDARADVARALDTLFAGGDAIRIESVALATATGPLPVSVGLAPLRRGLITTAVQAVFAKCG